MTSTNNVSNDREIQHRVVVMMHVGGDFEHGFWRKTRCVDLAKRKHPPYLLGPRM